MIRYNLLKKVGNSMKVKAEELYEKGLISRNVLYLEDKKYKIIGYDHDTNEFDLMEVEGQVTKHY